MASAIASVLPGFLHSTSTSGMPFTNSTSSGTMNFLPWVPGMSTRNCETTTKSLCAGMLPVDVLDPLVPAAVPARQTLYRDPVEQEVGRLLVRLQQARCADPGQRVDRLDRRFPVSQGFPLGSRLRR